LGFFVILPDQFNQINTNLKKFNLFLSAAALSGMLACSGNQQTAQEEIQGDNVVAEPAAVSAEFAQKMKLGEQVYQSYCIACHQKDGSGVPGAFPPLRETDCVNGEKSVLISAVLNGLQGPIEVNGEPYNNVMTAHDFLTDEEVAAVLTYVRNSFGNQASEVSAQEVADLRGL